MHICARLHDAKKRLTNQLARCVPAVMLGTPGISGREENKARARYVVPHFNNAMFHAHTYLDSIICFTRIHTSIRHVSRTYMPPYAMFHAHTYLHSIHGGRHSRQFI